MFCPNCGKKLSDGCRFCGECGKNLVVETGDKDNIIYQKRKKLKKKILGVLGATICVVAIGLGIRFFVSKIWNTNAYVYFSEGNYELLTNLESEHTVKLTSSDSDNTSESMVAFSPDEKYVYYYSKYDSSSNTGTLCRAEYGKLKENSEKNKKYIDVIARDIKVGLRFVDSNLLYRDKDNTLYYYDGKSVKKLGENVEYYYVDEAGNILFETGNMTDGYVLYGVSKQDFDHTIKLVSNIVYMWDFADSEHIYYTRTNEENTQDLYCVGFSKDEIMVAEDITNLGYMGEKRYFLANEGKKLFLYDYVNDPYSESDAKLKEPEKEDFVIPVYDYKWLSESNLSEDDYDELYTSCTEVLYWYGEDFERAVSMELAELGDWGDENDAIIKETKAFIEKYSEQANEDGFILVTKEVEAALKKINTAAGEDESKWLWLCYTRYQSGTRVDYNAFYDACEEWDDINARILLRESLKDKENAYPVQTLYCLQKNTLIPVNEKVLNVQIGKDGILFNTTEQIETEIEINDIKAYYEVNDLFDIDYKKKNYICLADSTVCQLSDSAADTMEKLHEYGDVLLWCTEKDMYLNINDSILSRASIENGVVDKFCDITDDARILSSSGSCIYYASNINTNGTATNGDLYSSEDGISVLLGKKVSLDDICLYEDGMIFAYAESEGNSQSELAMIDGKDKTTYISDGVTEYTRLNKDEIMYISDGDLYVYDGKKNKKIQRNVDQFWCKQSMKIKVKISSSY